MADPSEIRRQLAQARAHLTELEVQAAEAAAELERARREHGDDHDATLRAIREQTRADEALARGRRTEQDARGALVEGVAAALAGARIEADFAKLDAAFPIVLLPVRVETRFAGAELLIRVYPDDIAGESHEPELTAEERDLAFRYWRAVWLAPDQAPDEWKKLLVDMAPGRAAWAVRVTTPTNLADTPRPAEPVFPAVPLKTGPWTRATETRVLPDRWVALGFRSGTEVARAVSGPVVEPLVLSLEPSATDAENVDLSGDGLAINASVAWTMDFARAEAAGMALRMPLGAGDVRAGFDELVVLGVKSTLAPDGVADRLTGLLDAHHYGRGLGFLRQGTPTNNTRAAPSGFPPADPEGRASFATELSEPLAQPGASGDLVARALGIASGVFDHVAGADRDEQAGARAMVDVLWPATWGYFLEQLVLGDDAQLPTIDAFRRHVVAHVRGRGHHPAFRVGGTPYGVLVASSLDRWQVRGERSPLERALPVELRRLVPLWSRAVPGVPRVGRSADPDADLVGMLEMDASAREIRVRSVLGAAASYNLAGFLAADWNGWASERLRLALSVARLLGRTEAASRIFGLSYGKSAFRFEGGFVVPKAPQAVEVLSETDPLDFNYIAWIRGASLDDLRHERLPAGVLRPSALLYRLLRHGFLREVADAGDRILVDVAALPRSARREAELVGMTVTAPEPAATAGTTRVPPSLTVWERLAQNVPAVTGRLPLSRFLLEGAGHAGPEAVASYRRSLEVLEALPTAELERLFTESLDLCSHRLDAWITALFAQQLDAMRQANPRGAHLGAFAWVENLRPAPGARRAPLPADRRRRLDLVAPALAKLPLEEQVSTGGHIHAPSMTHAAAAAVLRNGFLSRRGAAGERYGVNLSSARVRQARWLLAAVRNGQALGAVLGYQFERGLHEEHAPLELDKYIEPFRALFPLEASKLIKAAPDEPVEAVAARSVVDGLALHQARKRSEIPWGTKDLPALSTPDQVAIEAELARLDESIDALADLLTAEAVYQLVRGSTTAAAATLDSLAKGVRPPDPEIAETPRGGSAVHHRALLVLGGDAIPPTGWEAVGATPRSRAEPHLDGWLGTLIGDPANVRCRVTYADVADPAVVHDREVTLAALDLRPIDVLAIATAGQAGPQTAGAAPTASAQVSELDARIAWFVLGLPDAAPDAAIAIDYALWDGIPPPLRGGGQGVAFPEVAELMRAVAAVLGTARSLEPRDLLAPDRASLASEATVLSAEAQARGDQAASDLAGAVAALESALAPLDVDPRPVGPDLAPLRNALVSAARFGVAGAMPDRRAGNSAEQVEALIAQARSVRGELARRSTAATAATTPAARAAAVFGDAFRLLTRFVPVPAELDQALATGPTPAPDATAVRRWLHGAALVHAPLERYKQLTMRVRALGRQAPGLAATQLPHRPGARWVAEPFGDEADRPPSGSVSLVLLRAAAPPVSDPWVGLAIDEWTELIPNRVESTAVAFHYDDPGSEAPQVILVAVPPTAAPQWSLDTAVAIVRETFELAKLRAVDAEMLPDLSQVLPAAYVAANPKNETVSTAFGELLRGDFAITRAP